MLKNSSGQKWRVLAFRPDNSRAEGDAANITAKISIDHGALQPLTDTNPVEVEDGYYLFDLTQAETNGDVLSLYPESSSPDVFVLGDPPSINTFSRYLQAY
jgi:hypothetical protein